MYSCAPILSAYIITIVMSSSWNWSLDHYVVSFLTSCNLLYFKVYFVWYEDCYSSFFASPFARNIFFRPLIFGLCVSLSLKWVSCRQHVYGLAFVSIQPICVFWLEHLVHLHPRYFLICMILLPFTLLLWVSFCRPVFSIMFLV